MPLYATICHYMQQYATMCNNMPLYATIHHYMPPYATICYKTLQYAINTTVCYTIDESLEIVIPAS